MNPHVPENLISRKSDKVQFIAYKVDIFCITAKKPSHAYADTVCTI